MKIALLGYGKMGKAIEAIALKRGHTVVLKVGRTNAQPFPSEELRKADVAIEFSTPKTVVQNILHCLENKVPVVVGTTGWNAEMEYVAEKCREYSGTLFHASNFSLGVNLFFRLNKQLAALMKPYEDYDVTMEEIHHIHKLDAPSGTAITLADGILQEQQRKTAWKNYTNELPEKTNASELPIVSKRIDEVPGTHTVFYTSATDRISITHEAFNREGFAMGAVIAAEFVIGKKGLLDMNDLLGE